LLDIIFLAVTSLYFLILVSFFIGLFFPNKNQSRQTYFVSVVVAARNEEKNIGHLLTELVNQTYPADRFEIIIANDGSDDGTADVIESFARKYPNVKQVLALPDAANELTAKKNALNQGIGSSRGDLIVTTDADCHVQPTWIETMVSYFTDDVGMVVGFSQLGKREYNYSIFEGLQALDFLSLLAAAQGSLNLNWPLAASGQNLVYRRKAFEQVGGFTTIKQRISGDDVLLLQLIKNKTNWKIRFAPSIRSFNWTTPERTLKSFLNQRKRWASNGSYQFHLNKFFFLFIVTVFFMNLLALIGTPVYAAVHHSLALPLGCIAAKIGAEMMVIVKGSHVYQRTDLLKYSPIWIFLQIPYVIFTGLMGSLGHFIWKDRKHIQELTIFRTDH